MRDTLKTVTINKAEQWKMDMLRNRESCIYLCNKISAINLYRKIIHDLYHLVLHRVVSGVET